MRLELHIDGVMFDEQPARFETVDWESKEFIDRYKSKFPTSEIDVFLVIPQKEPPKIKGGIKIHGLKCFCKNCTLKPIKTKFNHTVNMWVAYCKYHLNNTKMNELEYALKIWREKKEYMIFYNSHILVNSSGDITGGGFMRLEKYGGEYIMEKFKPSEESIIILHEYYQHINQINCKLIST